MVQEIINIRLLHVICILNYTYRGTQTVCVCVNDTTPQDAYQSAVESHTIKASKLRCTIPHNVYEMERVKDCGLWYCGVL